MCRFAACDVYLVNDVNILERLQEISLHSDILNSLASLPASMSPTLCSWSFPNLLAKPPCLCHQSQSITSATRFVDLSYIHIDQDKTPEPLIQQLTRRANIGEKGAKSEPSRRAGTADIRLHHRRYQPRAHTLCRTTCMPLLDLLSESRSFCFG